MKGLMYLFTFLTGVVIILCYLAIGPFVILLSILFLKEPNYDKEPLHTKPPKS